MKDRLCLLFWIIAMPCSFLSAQVKSSNVTVCASFNGQIIHIGTSGYETNDSLDLKIKELRFYISNIRFLRHETVVFREPNSYHLIDLGTNPQVSFRVISDSAFVADAIRFDLGIDSVTNAGGVMGGDLDPTKGMYWSWQSGYINFKLEGERLQGHTRNHRFEFHLGGYLNDDYCLNTITIPLYREDKINLVLDLSAFMKGIDLNEEGQVMSPGKTAVILSRKVANCFSIVEN